ncbi:MAG: hypothetical protein ACRC45_01235 [Cetobacterium sp.]
MKCLSSSKLLGDVYSNYFITKEGKLFRLYHSGKAKGIYREIKGSVNPDGYVRVDLRKRTVENGESFTQGKCHFMHKIVSMVFMDYEGEIGHIDRNKKNNSLDNLRKTNRSENNRNKLQDKNRSKEKFLEEYDEVVRLKKLGLSNKAISDKLNISYQKVRTKLKILRDCCV